MTRRTLQSCAYALGLLTGLGMATFPAGAANASPVVAPRAAAAGDALLVPVWWHGPNGGICTHAPNGAVQCRPRYGRPPNPAYYRPGHNWVPGHWFRGRWIGGHWS